MTKKQLFIYILFLIFILISSIPVHESVHWIQGIIDQRVEPSKFTFFDMAYNIDNNTAYFRFTKSLGTLGLISKVDYSWTTDNITERQAFSSEEESNNREIWAYGFTFAYIGAVFLIFIHYLKRLK